MLSNALKFSPRGSLVTIRAGFKAKSPTQTTSIDDIAPNGHPSSMAPRGSLQRIKEAILKKSGSLLSRNSAQNSVRNIPPKSESIGAVSHNPNGHPSSMAPRGSLQRIKEAILKKSGSLLSRNSVQNSVRNALPPKSESIGAASHNSGFRSFRFGQSVRGGAVGPNPPSTDDVIGK